MSEGGLPGDAASGRSFATRLREHLSFPRRPGQIPALDGLRAIAIILVLLRHAAHVGFEDDVPLPEVAGLDPGAFMLNGWVGVDLFFVLSGFLITDHILRRRERAGGSWTWGRYLSRRALRIVPAYYVVLLLAVIGAFPGFEVASEKLGWRVLYHLLFLQDVLPSNIVVAFWSLGVEEKFYLVAPLLVTLGAAKTTLLGRLRWPLLLLAWGLALRVILMLRFPDVDTYDAFFPVFRSPFAVSLDAILVGVAIAFVRRDPASAPRLTSPAGARTVFWLGALSVCVLLVGGEMLDTIDWWDKTLQPLAIALAFGAVTFGLLFGGGPVRPFGGRALMVVARLSYCLYLVHMPLIPLALAWTVAEGEPTAFAPFMAAFLGLSFAVALLLHYVVEKPFLVLKDRIR